MEPQTNAESKSLHVVIAGAGPVGLAAGLLLCQKGMRVTVLERASREKLFQDQGSGFDLTPSTLYILQKMGLYEELCGKLSKEYQVIVALADGTEMSRGSATNIIPSKLGDFHLLPMSRSLLQEALLQASEDYQQQGKFVLHCDSMFVDYEDPVDGNLKITFTNQGKQNKIEGDVLLGCDGVHSRVRKAYVNKINETKQAKGLKPIKDELKYSGIAAWWSKMNVEELIASQDIEKSNFGKELRSIFQSEEHVAYAYFPTSKLPFSFFVAAVPDSSENISDKSVAVSWFANQAEVDSSSVGEDGDLTKRGGISGNKAHDTAQRMFFKSNGKPRARNLDSNLALKCLKHLDPESLVRCGLYDRENLDLEFSNGRICITGDAAHPQTPFLGQGLNMGMTDAYCLSLYLSEVQNKMLAAEVDVPQEVVKALNEYDNIERRKGSKKIVKKARSSAKYSVSGNMLINTGLKLALRVLSFNYLSSFALKDDAVNERAILRAEKKL